MGPMDTVGLIALLREAAPTAQLEDAPGIDLQPTIYAARDDMPELARALRDRPELHERGTAWSEASRAAFLDGYGKPLDRPLLRALELEKAAYEFGYAEAFLPDWRPVAEAGLELLLARDIEE